MIYTVGITFVSLIYFMSGQVLCAFVLLSKKNGCYALSFKIIEKEGDKE